MKLLTLLHTCTAIAPQAEKFEMRFAKTTSISGKLEILTCINYSFHSTIFLKVVLTKVAYFHRIFGILINLDNTGVLIGKTYGLLCQ